MVTTILVGIACLAIGFAGHFFYVRQMGGKYVKISIQTTPGRKKGG